jgi:hypothetical protein
VWWCRGESLSDEETLLEKRTRRGSGREKSPQAHGGRELGTGRESEDDELLQDHQVGQVGANCSSGFEHSSLKAAGRCKLQFLT